MRCRILRLAVRKGRRSFISSWAVFYYRLDLSLETFRLEDKGNFVHDFNFYVMRCWFHQILVVSKFITDDYMVFRALTVTTDLNKVLLFLQIPHVQLLENILCCYLTFLVFFSLYAMPSKTKPQSRRY